MTKFAIRRRPLAMLGLCTATVGAGPAEAVVRYELLNQTYEFLVPPDPAFTSPPMFSLALTVSDAAVARGSFSVRVDANVRPQTVDGDAADFVSLTTRDDTYSPTGPTSRGFADIRLTFDGAGDVASSAIRYFGDLSGANLRGTGGATSGFYVREGGGCYGTGASEQCSVSGVLSRTVVGASAPEPAGLALLGFGLLGMAAARRRVRPLDDAAHARVAHTRVDWRR